MSGGLVHAGAVISCPHGGVAAALSGAAGHAVLMGGLPVRTAGEVPTIVGCRHTADGVPVPCTTVRWTADSGGVLVDGVPVVTDGTAGMCFTAGLVPQGPPVVAVMRGGVMCG
ncbi:hypothetical protein [Streptomyces pinistramenti]|uniref:hypothetical protein n=1 Tax=Streptomyces pinistramenti TaxID=2884812 RepID=UPI001D0832C3|nr:hypothetical protein [Streptomyces pinistramenti]MCB5911746.1 hypothetical protein [Streptomyces pinistramenti]